MSEDEARKIAAKIVVDWTLKLPKPLTSSVTWPLVSEFTKALVAGGMTTWQPIETAPHGETGGMMSKTITSDGQVVDTAWLALQSGWHPTVSGQWLKTTERGVMAASSAEEAVLRDSTKESPATSRQPGSGG